MEDRSSRRPGDPDATLGQVREGLRRLAAAQFDGRVEVPAGDLRRVVELRETIVPAIKALGFAYVTLDLRGFRSGSMNEVLDSKKTEK